MANLGNTTEYQDGRFDLTETQIAPKVAGFAITGKGAVPNINPADIGSASRLTWIGPTPGDYDNPVAMIEARGTNGWIDKISLHGRPFETTGGRADVGLYVRRFGSGLGTGKNAVGQLCIADCVTGIRQGDDGAGQATDEQVYSWLQVEGCDRAWLGRASQSMNYTIHYYRGRGMPVHFEIVAGGHYFINSGRIDSGTLFYFPYSDPIYRPLDSNAQYEAKGLHLDEGGTPKLVHMDGGGLLFLRFEDVTIGNLDYGPNLLASVRNRSVAVFDGVRNLQAGMIEGLSGGQFLPLFQFRACRLVGGATSLSQLFSAGSQHQPPIDLGGNHTDAGAIVGVV